jgi:hypothetical protein
MIALTLWHRELSEMTRLPINEITARVSSERRKSWNPSTEMESVGPRGHRLDRIVHVRDGLEFLGYKIKRGRRQRS